MYYAELTIYVITLHYITFENVPFNYNNYLSSEWGKFKLAK